MLETSKAVAIILVFTILVQFLVERIKKIVGEKVMGYVKAPVWAAALGILASGYPAPTLQGQKAIFHQILSYHNLFLLCRRYLILYGNT